MSTIKFDEIEAETQEIETQEPAAIVEQSPTGGTHALTQVELSDAGLGGEWGVDDIAYPKLKVLAPQSDLVTQSDFPAGSINLNGEHTLALKDKPLKVCVLICDKFLQEDIDFDSGAIPRQFASLQEARAEGFTTEYGAANRVRPACRILFAIRKPDDFEDTTGVFAYEMGGHHYTLAGATFSKTAFNTTGKAVYSYTQLTGNPVKATWWVLTSSLKEYNSNKWYSPTLRRAEALTEQELDFVNDLA